MGALEAVDDEAAVAIGRVMNERDAHRKVDRILTQPRITELTLLTRCTGPADFAHGLREVLASYYLVADDADVNHVRPAKAVLKRLHAALATARALLAATQTTLGVIDLGSYARDLPQGLSATLEAAESAVQKLRNDSGGAPTRRAVAYAIVRLLQLIERHEGIKQKAFVRQALALIGVTVTTRKINDVIAVHRPLTVDE